MTPSYFIATLLVDFIYGITFATTQDNPYMNPDYTGQYYQYPNHGVNRDPYFRRTDPHFRRTDGSPFEENGKLYLPGVLAGWRPDLQGKYRLESIELEKKRDVIVNTERGQIQGFRVNLYDNPFPESGHYYRSNIERIQGTVTAFLGIPYAMPPINERRFKPPRMHTSWPILHAVDYKPACPQPNTTEIPITNEDCLYLNIFTPTTDSGIGKSYPVMVYIHGGEFSRGAGHTFQGHVLAAFYEVVVVTINYRLGALGFLSTGDYNSPGNYGLLDQSMALTWIYENIHSFNGDRESITLFGPDAGAASAGLHMVNPRTSHIVAKVIAQSGSALADWALIQDKWRAQNTSKVFAQHLGCSIESTWKLVECLRVRSFRELGNADFKPEIGLMAWGPVLDTNITMPSDKWYDGWYQADWYFMNETVEQLIDRRAFRRGLVYMTGVTTQEAAYIISQNKSLAPTYDITQKLFDERIREMVTQYNYTLNPKGVFEAIKFMYTNWPDKECLDCIRNQFINMYSDFLYVAPHDKMMKKLLANKVTVYAYVMNTTVEAFQLPEWRKAPHNIEQYLLIGAPFLDSEMLRGREKMRKDQWTFNDRNMSHFFMKAFSNFAKHGNPTFTQILGLHFEEAMIGRLKYLNINTTYNSTILMNYRQTECGFWSDYLPTVIGNLLPLYPVYSDLWWLQSSPVHIAFWSVSLLCMLLLAITVIMCMLWINTRREVEHYYNEDFIPLEKETEMISGIENRSPSNENIYEYRDLSSAMSNRTKQSSIGKSPSASTLRTNSMVSLREQQQPTVSYSPKVSRKRDKRIISSLDKIPQTAV